MVQGLRRRRVWIPGILAFEMQFLIMDCSWILDVRTLKT